LTNRARPIRIYPAIISRSRPDSKPY